MEAEGKAVIGRAGLAENEMEERVISLGTTRGTRERSKKRQS